MRSEGVLQRILERTRESVQERKRSHPLHRLQMSAPTPGGRRRFAEALCRPGQVNVIAEFKRRSPSRGVLRDDLSPIAVAQQYEVAGATALSVLTEGQFFGGSLDDLRQARAATLLPVLRKDFIVDAYQVSESALCGADALLLIVAALDDAELRDLFQAATAAGLDTLVEVHDRAELARALRAGARIVGVNSRDLRTLEVNLRTASSLAPHIPDDVVAVAESGIRSAADIVHLRAAGYDAFLIGEHLMLGDGPGPTLERLLEAATCAVAGRARPARVAVKVCGITSVEDGLLAASAGADAVGFVFSPRSRRAVSVEAARAIARALPPFVHRVGVFVDAPREEIVRTVAEVGLDLVQLHGDEPPEALLGLSCRALKAVRVGPGFVCRDALRYGAAAGLVVDTREEGLPGGTGRTFDWSLVSELRTRAPYLVLAGGLTPDNVARAVAAVDPDAVDVSSGVEREPGRKDPAKVRAFVRAVREAAR